jgi:ribosomal protein L37AE/L43A
MSAEPLAHIKRAGLPTRQEPKPWQPTARMIEQLRHWARAAAGSTPWRVPAFAHGIIAGLDLDSDAGLLEAAVRYKTHIDHRQREKLEAAKLQPPRCSFCRQPKTERRIFVASGGVSICDRCIGRAARLIEKQKTRRKRRR